MGFNSAFKGLMNKNTYSSAFGIADRILQWDYNASKMYSLIQDSLDDVQLSNVDN